MCFNDRKQPVLVIQILSIIVLILSLLIGILTIRFQIGNDKFASQDITTSFSNKENFTKNISFYILSSAAILSFISAIGGFLFGVIKAKQYAMAFGALTVLPGIYISGLGLLLGFTSNAAPETVEKFCRDQLNSEIASDWSNQVKEFDSRLNTWTDKTMCSSYCPCKEEFAGNWTSIGEVELNKHQRTKAAQPRPTSIADDQGLVYLVFSQSGEIESFEQCVEYMLAGKSGASVQRETTKNFDQLKSIIAIMTSLERHYQCSGVCNSALFYFSLKLRAGVPSQTCLGSMKKHIGSNLTYLGMTSVATGVVMFGVWIMQFALWWDYNEDDMDEKFQITSSQIAADFTESTPVNRMNKEQQSNSGILYEPPRKQQVRDLSRFGTKEMI